MISKITTLIVFAALWQLLAMGEIVNTRIVHSPMHLITTVLELLIAGELWSHVYSSIKRVMVGFLIASTLGVLLGFTLAMYKKISTYLTVLIELIRPIPPIAWIPLAILWFGIGDRSSYFIVFIGAYFPIFINTFNGIRGVQRLHVMAAKSLGANQRLILIDVLLPAALPSIITGLRVGLGIAWTSVIAAELVGAQSGLGYMIQLNRILLQTDKILAGMITIGVIGSVMNHVMIVIERRCLYWRETIVND